MIQQLRNWLFDALRRASFGIDVFEWTLEGLPFAEAEFDSAADADAWRCPLPLGRKCPPTIDSLGDSLSGRHEGVSGYRCCNTESDSGDHTDPLPTEENASVAGVNCL